MVGVLLSSMAASIWLAATGQHDLSLAGRAVSQLGLWVGLAGAPVAASRLKGARSLRSDFGLAFERSDVLTGVLAGLGCQGAVLLIGVLAQPFIGAPDVSKPTRDLVHQANGFGLVSLGVFIAFVTIGAPIIEELFFRGLVLRSLEGRMSVNWSIAVTGAVFGLAHVQDLPAEALILAMVSLSVVGAILAVVAVKTGRLGAGIIAHFTFNALTVVYLLAGR